MFHSYLHYNGHSCNWIVHFIQYSPKTHKIFTDMAVKDFYVRIDSEGKTNKEQT